MSGINRDSIQSLFTKIPGKGENENGCQDQNGSRRSGCFWAGVSGFAPADDGINDRGTFVRGTALPTMFESRNGAVTHAVSPFTAEERAWLDRARRNY